LPGEKKETLLVLRETPIWSVKRREGGRENRGIEVRRGEREAG